jgi:hypothetical protein
MLISIKHDQSMLTPMQEIKVLDWIILTVWNAFKANIELEASKNALY